MQRACSHFLADPGFAFDQYIHVGIGALARNPTITGPSPINGNSSFTSRRLPQAAVVEHEAALLERSMRTRHEPFRWKRFGN
jgi:hypothetical protein